jgi:glycosyltransferase involved in cell wall biosynthesis
MLTTLRERGLPADNLHVINNFSLVEPSDDPPPRVPDEDARPFVVVFSGNLGRFQSLETVVDAAHHLRGQPIELWLQGEGMVLEDLRRRAGDLAGKSVHFLPYQSPEQAFSTLRKADLALVTLKPGLYRVCYPSKTMTCLAAGCRLLVMAERESELVETVVAHDVGTWCPPEDARALAQVIATEARRRDRATERGRILDHARTTHGREVVLPRWEKLVETIAGRARSRRETSR